ncbi:MAG: histidine kinase, partial [Alteraurantiacibacter sp.]
MDFAAKTEKHIARLPFKTVLMSVIGLWATYFILVSTRSELLEMPDANALLWLRLVLVAVGILITLGLWVILRAFDGKQLWMKIVAALVFALPAALLCAQANRVIFADAQAALEEKVLQEFVQTRGFASEDDNDSTRIYEGLTELVTVSARTQLIEITYSRYFMLLAWCALYLALLTGQKARVAERREQQFRNAAKAAELQSLRYQVNPHFLFNTLNS